MTAQGSTTPRHSVQRPSPAPALHPCQQPLHHLKLAHPGNGLPLCHAIFKLCSLALQRGFTLLLDAVEVLLELFIARYHRLLSSWLHRGEPYIVATTVQEARIAMKPTPEHLDDMDCRPPGRITGVTVPPELQTLIDQAKPEPESPEEKPSQSSALKPSPT